jgi:hypothetical protein
MVHHWRLTLLIAIIIGSFLALMAVEPIAQDLNYYNFADQRSFWGIPNFFDIVSNIPFFIIGLIGLLFFLKHKEEAAPWSWRLFFFGVTLVAFSSSYYHLDPNNQTVVWDRIAITMGFMGVLIGLLAECIHPKIEKYFLFPTASLGIASVLYWYVTDDLRFYAWIQFMPLLVIPIALLLFKGRYTHKRYLLLALLCYVLAKVTEVMDRQIFLFTYEQLSGHTIKHLFAALGAFWIYWMLKRRGRVDDDLILEL